MKFEIELDETDARKFAKHYGVEVTSVATRIGTQIKAQLPALQPTGKLGNLVIRKVSGDRWMVTNTGRDFVTFVAIDGQFKGQVYSYTEGLLEVEHHNQLPDCLYAIPNNFTKVI